MNAKNQLLASLQTNDSLTLNGAVTHSTSGNALVDFMAMVGSARRMAGDEIYGHFTKAVAQDTLSAFRLLFWCRDVRGGAGERRAFREVLSRLADERPEIIRPLVSLIPEYGRFDDLFVLFGTALERDALRVIAGSLREENGLCAKWMPRKGPNANKIRAYLRLTPKAYRKLLVGMTNVVESAMCAKDYRAVNYGKLPSLASSRYQTAFMRNDRVGYDKFLDRVLAGEEKINASAIFPHDVVKSLDAGNARAASAQWANLPDYLEGRDERVLVVVDTSGSMFQTVGGKSSTRALDVSVAMGMYFAERLSGAFKDTFITFSERPSLQTVTGNLADRYRQLNDADWGYNTNLNAVFKLVLNTAVMNSVPVTDMPTTVLIVSDMEFDSCSSGKTNFDTIDEMFRGSGYERPNLVFWNVAARTGNVPVKENDAGVALVSGFSPATISYVLGTEAPEEAEKRRMTPVEIMENVVNSERYAAIVV